MPRLTEPAPSQVPGAPSFRQFCEKVGIRLSTLVPTVVYRVALTSGLATGQGAVCPTQADFACVGLLQFETQSSSFPP